MRLFLLRNVIIGLLLGVISSTSAATNEDFRVVFDPRLRPLIQNAITQSKREINIEVFKMTDRGVIANLGDAAQRGLTVRIILCPTQKSNHKTARKLMKNGVAVRWYPITKKNQIMHVKMGIFDNQRLIFGSPNWTYWGLTIHHEGVFDIQKQSLVTQLQEQFSDDWNKSVPAKP